MEVDDSEFTDEGGGTMQGVETTPPPSSRSDWSPVTAAAGTFDSPGREPASADNSSPASPSQTVYLNEPFSSVHSPQVEVIGEGSSSLSPARANQEVLSSQPSEGPSVGVGSAASSEDAMSDNDEPMQHLHPMFGEAIVVSSPVLSEAIGVIEAVSSPSLLQGRPSDELLQEHQEMYEGPADSQPASAERLRQQQRALQEFFPSLDRQPSSPTPSSSSSVTGDPSPSTPSGSISSSSSLSFQIRPHNFYSGVPPCSPHSAAAAPIDFSPSNTTSISYVEATTGAVLLHPSLRHLGPHDLAVALLRHDKREVSHNLKQECIGAVEAKDQPPNAIVSQTLWCMLELLLNVNQPIHETHVVDWVKYLIAGGEEPQEFTKTVASYDTRTACAVVWTCNYLAHRCLTCGTSPCMSLCSDCFNEGDHRGHDYNFFRSSSGGACDCGNASVLKPSGFCSRHKLANTNKAPAPQHLLLMLRQIIPHIITRLLFHFRECYMEKSPIERNDSVNNSNELLQFCQELCEQSVEVVALFREVLCDEQVYENFKSGVTIDGRRSSSTDHLKASKEYYEAAIGALPVPLIHMPDDFTGDQSIVGPIQHCNILEEMVFWLLTYELPERLSCFLISMRNDLLYEAAFSRAFVLHYGQLFELFKTGSDFKLTSTRVVHVSVQLFSDGGLAQRIVTKYPLLEVLMSCLRNTTDAMMIDLPIHGESNEERFWQGIDIDHQYIRDPIFWPFLSDLNNLLSHKSVTDIFIKNDWLRHQYLTFCSSFQFMNAIKKRSLSAVDNQSRHINAFSCEIQVLDVSLWCFLHHLTDADDPNVINSMLLLVNHSSQLVCEWFNKVGFSGTDAMPDTVSFHLPLHRMLITFINHANRVLRISSSRMSRAISVLGLAMYHPLKTMLLYHETFIGIYKNPMCNVRNQVSAYITCSGFSLLHADLCLLQTTAAHLRPDIILMSSLHTFQVQSALSIGKISKRRDLSNKTGIHSSTSQLNNQPISPENMRLEMFLIHLCYIVAIRHNLERDVNSLIKKELCATLCLEDRTVSGLIESMPNKFLAATGQKYNIHKLIRKVSIAKPPKVTIAGECVQGMRRPKNRVWKKYYDPLHVLVKCSHRREYFRAQSRYHEYLRQTAKKKNEKMPVNHLEAWPPFIIPSPLPRDIADPQRMLLNRTFHAIAFSYLYKAVYDSDFNELMLPFLIYLLEMTVEFHVQQTDGDGGDMLAAEGAPADHMNPRMESMPSTWFNTDHIFRNAIVVIPTLIVEGVMNDDDMDLGYDPPPPPQDAVAELENTPELLSLPSPPQPVSLGFELVPYTPSGADTPETPTPLTPPSHRGDPLALLPPPLPSSSSMGPPSSLPPHSASISTCTEVVPIGGPQSPHQQEHQMFMSINPELVPQHHQQNRLPAPTQYPTLLAGNEVGRPGVASSDDPSSSSSSNTSSHHRQRRHTGGSGFSELEAGYNTGSSPNFSGHYRRVNESLVSLLIKLYPLVSSGAPYRPHFSQLPTSRHGNAGYFVSLLLNKMGHYDSATRDYILKVIREDATSQSEGTDESSSASPEEVMRRARVEKAKQAKLRMERVLASFKNRQKNFIQNYEGETSVEASDSQSGTSIEETTEVEDEELQKRGYDEDMMSRVRCCICGNEKKGEMLGLCVNFVANTSDSQRRAAYGVEHSFPLTEKGVRMIQAQYKNSLLNRAKERYQALRAAGYHKSWFLWENTGLDFAAIASSCGHFIHLRCQEDYLKTMPKPDFDAAVDDESYYSKTEYPCAMCRALCNGTLPLSPVVWRWITSGTVEVTPSTPSPSVVSPPAQLSPELVSNICRQMYEQLLAFRRIDTAGTKNAMLGYGVSRLGELPLSRIQFINESNSYRKVYNHGYYASCVRSFLQSQLNLQHNCSLVDHNFERPASKWDPTTLSSVVLFDLVSCYIHDDNLTNLRDWISDRWGQLCVQSMFKELETYDSQTMSSTDAPSFSKRFNRSFRYTHHNSEVGDRDKDDHSEEESNRESRYQNVVVAPLLVCDPVAILIQMWLILFSCPNLRGAYECLSMQCYRLVILQAVIAALRQLDNKEKREAVVYGAKGRLGKLLQLVYGSLKQHDSTVFYRHPIEVKREEMLLEKDQQEDVLVELRLQDIDHMKKLQKEERKRSENLMREDNTESEDSSSDESEMSEAQEPGSSGSSTIASGDVTAANQSIDKTDEQLVEEYIIGLCLDFLRISSMLKYQLYSERFPTITTKDEECNQLEQYLGVQKMYSVINNETIIEMCESSAHSTTGKSLIEDALQMWVPPLIPFCNSHYDASSVLLRRMVYLRPAFLELPKIYEFLFKFYSNRPCEECQDIVETPLLCLSCGSVVCTDNTTDKGYIHLVHHANKCGGSQGVFIAINETFTVINCGFRLLKWGSLYLDMNGEEDPGLRRGKTLRLNKERMNYLAQRYISNSLGSINGKWKNNVLL